MMMMVMVMVMVMVIVMVNMYSIFFGRDPSQELSGKMALLTSISGG